MFRLLSLLETILKKCKSSSNAVNNNYQVTKKSICIGAVQLQKGFKI